MHAEKPVLNSSGDIRKICTDTGRMQVNIDNPSREIFIGNEVGSDIENQI